jgi:23S rRNA (adenine2503-C2)-methyltransferase
MRTADQQHAAHEAHRDAQSPTSLSDATHLLSRTAEEIAVWLKHKRHPAYRGRQILQWIYDKQVGSFDEMTNLSKPLREWMRTNARLFQFTDTKDSVAADGTRKLLLTAEDGASVETVWIPADGRNTACISSQVGCPVGCRFCASGIGGVERNLTVGEIVEQALRVSRLVRAADEQPGRLSNIVLMGMGEPLANYDAVIKAVRILNAPWGLNIGARKITLSTVGLPKQIRRLAEEDLQLNLALSLHATNDALRAELIPWASGVKLADLIAACAYYFDRTGREITLEYVLLDGVNMGPRDADGLVEIARRLRANVNLLRYNPVPGLPFRRPDSESAHRFQNRLRERHVNAHIRTSRGKDVNAACGQLRRAENA